MPYSTFLIQLKKERKKSMKKIIAGICVFVGLLFGVVNINTASIDELKALKGVGETKAQAIIDYRKEQNFTSIDEIKKVKGIGNKVFEKIKDDIVVR